MRSSLAWILGVTVVASIVVVLGDDRGMMPALDVRPADREVMLSKSADKGGHDPFQGHGPAQGAALTFALPAWQVDPATRDVFRSRTEPAADVATSVEESRPSEVAPSPPPQTPLPVDVRFLGRMLTTDGRELVWLQLGGDAVSVGPGQALADGLEVVEIARDEVRLIHGATATEIRIPIPESAKAGQVW